MRLFIYVLPLLVFVSCKNEPKTEILSQTKTPTLELKYAEGFTVGDNGDHKILSINNPWPEATKQYQYLIVPETSNSNSKKQLRRQ